MATQTPELPASPVPGAPPPESDPVAQTLAFLQPWIDYVPQQQRRLGLFIFLALLAHLAAFFFIRIDTNRAELRHQARIHVTVEYPRVVAVNGQPGDDFWDRLTDPRIFLLPQQPLAGLSSDGSSLDFTGINSSLGSNQPPPPAPPEDFRFSRSAVTPLDLRAGEAMRPPRQPFFYDETPPAIATRTTWQWEKALGERHPTGLPDLPSPVSDTDLSPTELQVAVNSEGAVVHVLVEQSCGSGRLDLDQQAVLAARKIRFTPTEHAGLLWGRITVFWHYSAQPRVEVVPTPPSGP